MKNTVYRLSTFACLFTLQNAWSLDLTPHFVTRITGNQTEDIPYFLDGDTRYSAELPRGVSASQGEGTAIFNYQYLEGSLTMRPSPFKPDVLFGGPALEAYRKVALGFVPAGATDASIQQENPNPLTFNGWTSHRFTIGYQLPGRSFLQSVTFLNFSDRQQIVLITCAPRKNFEKAEALTDEIMGRWRKLRPGENIAFPPAQ